MSYCIDIQNATAHPLPLSEEEINTLAARVLTPYHQSAELTIRLVNAEEMISLNRQYRQQDKTTNVLAFPCTLPDYVELECPFLGDIIICPEVLLAESKQNNTALLAHWFLIIIHGILHLLGYDHGTKEEEKEMCAPLYRPLGPVAVNNRC